MMFVAFFFLEKRNSRFKLRSANVRKKRGGPCLVNETEIRKNMAKRQILAISRVRMRDAKFHFFEKFKNKITFM